MLYKDQKNTFPPTFWIANTMELFERWAYYGMFALLSVYLTDPVSQGGLGFSQEERGIMQAVVTAILYLLPILGGAVADRFGFRKVLLAAFLTLASGYFAMGNFHAYAPVFIAFTVVAVGGAMFKPIIVATVSKVSPKNKETLGFGIFYMIVNIGGFIGPFVAKQLRDLDWKLVFYMCTAVILINLVLLFFYKEPVEEKKEKPSLLESIKEVFRNAVVVLGDLKFMIFLLIIAGFWIVYMQLFFTIPVYITQWVDTSVIYEKLGLLKNLIGSQKDGLGVVNPEMMINIPAFTIILFQVLISKLLGRTAPLKTIFTGIIIVAFAYAMLFSFTNGWAVILMLVILAFGEMASSPRIQEYTSKIAPREKVALYMGFSFLPVAAGNLAGGLLSGWLYGRMADKYAFLREYLVQNTQMRMDEMQLLDDGELFQSALNQLNMTIQELNGVLYQTYHPGKMWLVFAAIGLLTALALFIYNRFIFQKDQ